MGVSAFFTGRWAKLAIPGGVLSLAAALAIWSLAGSSDSRPSAATTTPTATAVDTVAATARWTPTPTMATAVGTPNLLAGVPDIEDARDGILARSDALAAWVGAAEAGDVAVLLERMTWIAQACDDVIIRGKSLCELRGETPGTVSEWFLPAEGEERRGARTDIRDTLSYLLTERNPRLTLAAERDDGGLILHFAVDPLPERMFPGGEISGSNVVAVYFVTSASDLGHIGGFGTSNEGTPPLEFVRYDEFHGNHTYEIVGASDEFRAREQLSHDQNEAARHDAP